MKNDAALRFVCERSDSVLVIIECGHCDILLEPFNMIHKGNFARSPAFTEWRHNVNVLPPCGSAAFERFAVMAGLVLDKPGHDELGSKPPLSHRIDVYRRPMR